MPGGSDELAEVISDLAAEHAALDDLVADIGREVWDRPTPSEGWSIRDQIGHLWYFDRAAAMATSDPEAFAVHLESLLADATDPSADLDLITLEAARSLDAVELLGCWRVGRRDLLEAARSLDGDARIPWYGPPMRPTTFFAARLMETWAHGRDVADTLDVPHPPSRRLRWVADLGVRTRTWAYLSREISAPSGLPTIVLHGPEGEEWRWGPDADDEQITGAAESFCLVVTQRRHLADVDLEVRGPAAREWMAIAQAFAGPPTDGPPPRSRRGTEAAS